MVLTRIPAAVRTSGMPALHEETFEGGGAEVDDAAEVGRDEEAVDKRAAGDCVFDFVVDKCAAIFLFEGMFVMPVAVGAAELVIGEKVGWIPAGDFAFPADRNAVKFEFVLDARAEGNGDWFRREDLEIEEGRSELFEMFSGGEEGEDF